MRNICLSWKKLLYNMLNNISNIQRSLSITSYVYIYIYMYCIRLQYFYDIYNVHWFALTLRSQMSLTKQIHIFLLPLSLFISFFLSFVWITRCSASTFQITDFLTMKRFHLKILKGIYSTWGPDGGKHFKCLTGCIIRSVLEL